jgi:hypothetical protein
MVLAVPPGALPFHKLKMTYSLLRPHWYIRCVGLRYAVRHVRHCAMWLQIYRGVFRNPRFPAEADGIGLCFVGWTCG